jgi:uncharacterized protein (DUF58 family)
MATFAFNPFARKSDHGLDLLALRGEAEDLSARLPPLMVEAERVAATVAQGVHGRRRVGLGESFWQFRRHRDEDSSQAIDWRQSAKSQHLFVREREWEASESVWFWRDASPSMAYRSQWAPCAKVERATVLALALASLLVRGGERVAVLAGANPPAHGKLGYNRLARALTRDLAQNERSTPPRPPIDRYAQIVLIGDWLCDIAEVESEIAYFASRGVKGHLVQVLDPAEEDLPFDGRTEFVDVEGPTTMIARRAEALRDAYRLKLTDQKAALAQACLAKDWTFASHRTDRPPQAALLALYGAMTAHQPMGGGPAKL